MPEANAGVLIELVTGPVVSPPRPEDGGAPVSPAERVALVLRGLVGQGVTPISALGFETWAAATAPASMAALASDLACYGAFCTDERVSALLGEPEALVRYVGYLERLGRKPATIARRLASVATLHQLFGAASPTQALMVRHAVKAMRRRQGVAQKQAGPLRFGEAIDLQAASGLTLTALLEACDGDIQGLRDAALISLAYDCGLRVSELVAVAPAHLEPDSDGTGTLFLPSSKTDQEGQGAHAWVSADSMRRIGAWLAASGIEGGPLFRRVGVDRRRARDPIAERSFADLAMNAQVNWDRMRARPAQPARIVYTIGQDRLTRQGVNGIYRRIARTAANLGLVALTGSELDAAIAALSSHSMRVGLTQDLLAAGEDGTGVAQALRWRSTTTVLRYGRKLAVRSNAAARVLRTVRG